MRKVILSAVAGLLVAGNALADAAGITEVRSAMEQGGFYVAKVPVGSTVMLNETSLWVGPKGEVVIGFDRNQKPKAKLKVCDVVGQCTIKTLTVAARDFKTQNVKGIPPKTVDPSPAETQRTEDDAKATAAARAKAVEGASWRVAFMDGFKLPVQGPTSGVYGSRRTYNGQERSWHKGHDLAAKTGTPVYAPADGIVRLARDTFMSGNLIMLDHGGAITTVYAHLDSMNVKVGDTVTVGQLIGKVGTTGRSSGPHLHWGAYWQNVAIDPILWVVK